LIKKILILVLTLLLFISFLLFNDNGNQWLKPYLANYLERKAGGSMQMEIRHLKIDANYIEFDALLNDAVVLEVEGALSLLTQNLDLDYSLKSDRLKNSVDVKGTVIGSFSDMYIAGEGDIFNSTIDYRLYRKEDVLHGVKLKIDNANIASFLELTSQPAYARGRVDVDVSIPNLEKESSKPNMKMRFHGVTLTSKYVKGLWHKSLRRNITANLNFNVCNRYSELEGFVKSDAARLNLLKAHYDIETKELSSDYTLLVSKLSKFTNTRGEKLRGTLEVKGRFKSKKSQIELTGNSQSLGGEMVFTLHDNQLDAHMNGVDIEKVLYLLGEKRYVKGKLLADVALNDVSQQKGVFSFRTQGAQTVDGTLKEAFNLSFEKSLPFVLKGRGDIKGEKITMKSSVDSDIFHGDSSDITYDLITKVLKSHYQLHIPKLSKLNRVTGKNLKGELNVQGELNYDKEMSLTGDTDNFGGDIDFKLKADTLNLKLNNVWVEKFLETFSYPKLLKAKLVGSFNYDLANTSGKLTSKLTQLQLLNSSLINAIEKIKGSKIDDEHYAKSHFNATFQKNLVDINFKAQSKTLLLSIPSGRINQEKNTIYAYYRVKVDNIELEGKIRGALLNPEVTFNSSKYLQKNMMSVIEENMDPRTMGSFGMNKKKHDMMKNMMFDFFK